MNVEHYTNDPIKFTATTSSAITNRVGSKQPDEMAPDLGHNEFITNNDLKKETGTCQYLIDDWNFFRITTKTED